MIIQFFLTILVTIGCFLLFWKFWFLRDPNRVIPKGNNIISPADGKVIKILKLDSKVIDKLKIEKGLFGKILTIAKDVKNAGYLISIFMTPFDVHVQRAPVNGKIANVKYTKGKFMAANSVNALYNENNEILIEGNETVKVIQIAGFIARRIECFVKKGEDVKKGEKIGRINLGSQVTVIVPKNIEIKVKKGDQVKAGETILADFK
ncbi:phosphatidylserine decarboxylase [Candidatus Woesearchaeota archaeon]|jgi:phosphatidylserine decarboxylase|nr:phosphatidylserine decarboxylase [Candidatus Woesearchaeota archaeon]